ncbi:uncharacterized protein LOC115921306 [Strongylocentrotus purpuratus]|uniref:Endonuclease/exonuclease/phosphatase domain-containing protein n=1 Tax=Strongylocentrotus purpuratus TaxID=7668 RepID=A0A7M7NC51_STRPU|nr:uncharacterized protein LOC115921306 [Strongylocentrotus purpuratus]
MNVNQTDIAVLCETWLNDSKPDEKFHIPGFTLHRRDRRGRQGGGVAIYTRSDLNVTILDNATSPELEVLWIRLESQKLHTMFVAAVYAPPNSPFHQDLNDSLVETVDYIHTRFPESGIVILGDFNDMDTDSLASEIDFSQIVDKPTRGDNVLDKVLTNIADDYNRPAVINPIRNSDHRTIIVSPKATIPNPKRQKISIRPIRDSSIRSFGQWLTSVDWSWLLDLENAADMQVSFQDELTTAYERCFPQITFVRREDDKPWMNNRIRSLIDQRQAAYQSGNLPRYSQLRNQVEREIKATENKFFLGKVSHLKKSQPGKWHKEIRNITSIKKTSNKLPGSHMAPAEQADWINSHFANVCSSLPPLDRKSLPVYLPADSPPPEIQPYQVYNKLKKLKISKSSHTNDIPLRLVLFARVFEEFLVEWIRRDIADHIDPRQFGSSEKLERVQRRVTKIILGFTPLTYDERPAKCESAGEQSTPPPLLHTLEMFLMFQD